MVEKDDSKKDEKPKVSAGTKFNPNDLKFPQYGTNINLKNSTTYTYSVAVESLEKGLSMVRKAEREDGVLALVRSQC